MGKSKQKDFFETTKDFAPRRITHGGAGAKGMRKLARPLDRKRPVHLVLKSEHARGALSFLTAKNRVSVERIIRKRALQFAVKIHRKEVMTNHVHIVVSFTNRRLFQNFLRTVAALISREVTGARRGKPFGKRFWQGLLFSRVIFGRRDFKTMAGYLEKNQIEREIGFMARRSVEEYESAIRRAVKLKCDVWEVLEGGS
jgi:REP element-mobilizing transposase RayT